jgi:hypothetical protein
MAEFYAWLRAKRSRMFLPAHAGRVDSDGDYAGAIR